MGEDMKKYTVYIHIAPNGKKYIGITCQKLETRWGKNGRGYFHQNNSHLERAILKYGWDNFKHEIIADGLEEVEAKRLERKLIAKYNTNNAEFGYNKTGGGDGFLGVQRFGKNNSFYGKHHSKQAKKLIQKALGHEVCQFDFDLNFIKLHPSVNAAAKELNICASQIEGCVHQEAGYKSAGGYLWILKKDLSESKLNEMKFGLQHEKLPKPIFQYDLQMNFIAEYSSIREASRKTKIKASCISRASSNKARMAGNYIWILKETVVNNDFNTLKEKYIKNLKNNSYRRVCQFSLSGKYIQTFESLTLAGKSIGVSRPAIASACKSKIHISKGYIWRFGEEVEHE